jgi:hypothetical protein
LEEIGILQNCNIFNTNQLELQNPYRRTTLVSFGTVLND